MTDKNKVPQAVMDELRLVQRKVQSKGMYSHMWELLDYVNHAFDYVQGPTQLCQWVYADDINENRKREQDVIDFVYNGADNFEVKTPTWVIISEKNKSWNDWWSFIFVTDGLMERWEAYSYGNRSIAIKHATCITDPHIKDMLLELNKDFEAIEVEE